MTGTAASSAPFGLILAGGAARRMGGGDKALLPLGRGTLLESVAGRLAPQCSALAISANGDGARFPMVAAPVLADGAGPAAGPLAGVLAGLAHLERTGAAKWLLTVPGDTPFIPRDLGRRFVEAAAGDAAEVVHATSGGRDHPLVALWSVSVRGQLTAALARDIRSVKALTAAVRVVRLDWPAEPYDPFFNVNTPEDLEEARAILSIVA